MNKEQFEIAAQQCPGCRAGISTFIVQSEDPGIVFPGDLDLQHIQVGMGTKPTQCLSKEIILPQLKTSRWTPFSHPNSGLESLYAGQRTSWRECCKFLRHLFQTRNAIAGFLSLQNKLGSFSNEEMLQDIKKTLAAKTLSQINSLKRMLNNAGRPCQVASLDHIIGHLISEDFDAAQARYIWEADKFMNDIEIDTLLQREFIFD